MSQELRSDWPPFGERVRQAVVRYATPVVVGLDPRFYHLPGTLIRDISAADRVAVARAYRQFCFDVLDVVAPLVPAVKPQIAFFEELGDVGLSVLAEIVQRARRQGLLVILDAKRGDIGTTAEAYARAYLAPDAPCATDAITLHPFLGPDSWEPFAQQANAHGAGLFLLVKTSNPGSAFLQDILDKEGRPVYERVARWIATHNESSRQGYPYGDIGAVVGATYPAQLRQLRQLMPHTWILVPGYGAQGATARDTAGAFHEDGTGALINAARSVIFAYEREPYRSRFQPAEWQRAIEEAVRDMRDELALDTPARRLRSNAF